MVAVRCSIALALLAAACAAAQACPAPDGWRAMQVDNASGTSVALKLPTTPVKIGEPFAIDILVCSDGVPSAGNLKLNATMPAHKHGMNYRPDVQHVGSNVFRGTGMFFHMPGQWQISVDIVAGDEVERFVLKVPAR